MQLDEEGISRLEESVSSLQVGGISIEEYNRELEAANDSIDRGEGIPHEEVVKQLKGI